MIRINDAVSIRIGKLPAIKDAGKIVSPIQPAADDDIFRAGGADGIEHRLHPDTMIIIYRHVPANGLVRDLSAAEPDIP